MKIIPAVDIKKGRCVRLSQGMADQETVYSDDPVAMACHWDEEGASLIHIVDLDGAFEGQPSQCRNCKKYYIQQLGRYSGRRRNPQP